MSDTSLTNEYNIIERAAETVETVLESEYGGYQTPVANRAAQALADAGLLAKPRTISDENLAIVNGWLVETGHEGNHIPGYGIEPGSDVDPILQLEKLPGWSVQRELPTREQIAKRIHPGFGRPRYDTETCHACERAGEQADSILALLGANDEADH